MIVDIKPVTVMAVGEVDGDGGASDECCMAVCWCWRWLVVGIGITVPSLGVEGVGKPLLVVVNILLNTRVYACWCWNKSSSYIILCCCGRP